LTEFGIFADTVETISAVEEMDFYKTSWRSRPQVSKSSSPDCPESPSFNNLSLKMTSPVEKGLEARIEQAVDTTSIDAANTKAQLDRDQARELASGYVPDTEEEKAIVRKLDWRLVVSRKFLPIHACHG
jgi:hypothetical protein